jgi:hypothetical protein
MSKRKHRKCKETFRSPADRRKRCSATDDKCVVVFRSGRKRCKGRKYRNQIILHR